MVKIVVEEKCPYCTREFESMIEFDYNKSNSKPNTDFPKTESQKSNIQSFEKMFEGSLTLGKLMQIISLIGDASDKLGNQSVSLIIEQCKLMGLKKEDENIIYKIVEMVGKQDVSIRDVLVTLYRFAKILGINDDVADMYYYKLMINTDDRTEHDKKEIVWEGR